MKKDKVLYDNNPYCKVGSFMTGIYTVEKSQFGTQIILCLSKPGSRDFYAFFHPKQLRKFIKALKKGLRRLERG